MERFLCSASKGGAVQTDRKCWSLLFLLFIFCPSLFPQAVTLGTDGKVGSVLDWSPLGWARRLIMRVIMIVY